MSIEAKSLIDSLIDTYNPTSVLPFIGSDGFYHFLYLTYHKDTYKFYIGKHTTPNLDDGYIGSGSHFIRALNKHGKSSFINIRLLFLDNEIEAYLKEAELVTEDFIRKYRDELKVCYNLQSGGRGGSAYRSEDTRAKHKESINRPEYKAKHSQAVKESHARPEVKAKMSQSIKEALARPEVKAKISQAVKEALARPEVKAKISQSLARPEYKAKMSQASKETMSRPEVKAKMSQASKEAHSRPEVKAKHSQARARPEHKVKMSQAIKEAHSRPEVKAKHSQSLARPEYKAKMSQSLKEALARPEVKAKRSKASKERQSYKEMILHSTGETKKVHSSELLEYLKGGWRLTSTSLRLYKGTENKKHELNEPRWKKEIEKKKEEAHLILIELLEGGWQIGTLPKEVVGTEPDGVGEGEVKEYSGEYCDNRKMWSLF